MAKEEVSIEIKVDNTKIIKEALKYIKENEIYVGIPQDDDKKREEDVKEGKTGITNAELLFIHSKGSPVRNIPKRPVIEPAIKKQSDKISEYFKKAIDFILNQDYISADNMLHQIGLLGQLAARRYFVEDNDWPPDKPATIRAKIRKHKEEGYIPRTLIDTSQMRNAITYFVTKKGHKQ